MTATRASDEEVAAVFDQAKDAWLVAKQGESEAQQRVYEAREQLKMTERAHQLAQDATRAAWVAMKDAEWVHDYGKRGKWLSMQRFPDGRPAVPAQSTNRRNAA